MVNPITTNSCFLHGKIYLMDKQDFDRELEDVLTKAYGDGYDAGAADAITVVRATLGRLSFKLDNAQYALLNGFVSSIEQAGSGFRFSEANSKADHDNA